jgi:hypothetical protein
MIRERGHFVVRNGQQPPGAATKVRVRNGRISATDGPYAETKELLGGCDPIEAEDRQEATRTAPRIAGPWIGCAQVRPIAEDEEACRERSSRDVDSARGQATIACVPPVA